MPDSFVRSVYHCIWSTKGRRNLIPQNQQKRLWKYVGGIAKSNNMKALEIGGTNNHIHLLVSLPSTVSISNAVQLIKGGSSKWFRETRSNQSSFGWQKGYGAFSVSRSDEREVMEYIEHQHEHHRNISFREEFLTFLDRNDIDYNEEYVF